MKERVEKGTLAEELGGRACHIPRDIRIGDWHRSVRWVNVVDPFWPPWLSLSKEMNRNKIFSDGLLNRTWIYFRNANVKISTLKPIRSQNSNVQSYWTLEKARGLHAPLWSQG